MRFLDRTMPTAAEDLALDEALLLAAEAGGGEVLRVWERPDVAVVLGAGGVLGDDVDEAACVADGVPIERRASGGGTVLLGPGCLLYSLVLRYDRAPELAGIASSYRSIFARLGAALRPFAGAVEQAGSSDLTAGGVKFSGNAQQRKRDHLLHHGTLLYDFDLSLMNRYLREPPRRPDYRGERVHESFVKNLPATRAQLVTALAAAWEADGEPEAPFAEAERLAAEKYRSVEWVRRR